MTTMADMEALKDYENDLEMVRMYRLHVDSDVTAIAFVKLETILTGWVDHAEQELTRGA